MDIQIGTPRTDARYLCFVPHDVKREISKPIVLIWTKGRWCFDESSVEFPRKPVAWVGPLPAGKLLDLFPDAYGWDEDYSASAAKLAADIDEKLLQSIAQEFDL